MLPLAKDLKVLRSLEAGDEAPEHGEEVGAEAGAAGDAPQRHRCIYPHLKSVPYIWLTDPAPDPTPDPAIFVRDLQEGKKK